MLKKLILKMLGVVDKLEFDKFKLSCNEFMFDYLMIENVKLILDRVENECDLEVVVFVIVSYLFILGCDFKEICIVLWVLYVSIIGCRVIVNKGE